MNALEAIKAGYISARKLEHSTLPVVDLPFTPITKEEFLAKFEALKKGMRIEPLSREEGYLIALTETSWADSPESRLATLQAEQHFLTAFKLAQKDGESNPWKHLEPIYHKYAAKKAKELWERDRNAMLGSVKGIEESGTAYSSTVLHLANQYAEKTQQIKTAKLDIRKKKPNLAEDLLEREAIDQVLGADYQKKKLNNIKASKAYHHGKRLSRRDQLISETQDQDLQIRLLQEKITDQDASALSLHDEAQKSSWSIGRPARDFFDMGMFRITKLDPATGKVLASYPAGMIIQDPKHAKENKPDGVGILPWHVGQVEYSSDDVYVRIGLRNEPGAPNHVTAIAAEQTSIAKIENGDILNQAGKDIIAICVREELAVNCEKLPALTEAIPPVANMTLANRDTNRMGVKPNAYAAIKVEGDSNLMKTYQADPSGFWIALKDLETAMEETKEHEAIVNELLLAAKGQLDLHLRERAEAQTRQREKVLHDIATNPNTAFGWWIGSIVNGLEKLVS